MFQPGGEDPEGLEKKTEQGLHFGGRFAVVWPEEHTPGTTLPEKERARHAKKRET